MRPTSLEEKKKDLEKEDLLAIMYPTIDEPEALQSIAAQLKAHPKNRSIQIDKIRKQKKLEVDAAIAVLLAPASVLTSLQFAPVTEEGVLKFLKEAKQVCGGAEDETLEEIKVNNQQLRIIFNTASATFGKKLGQACTDLDGRGVFNLRDLVEGIIHTVLYKNREADILESVSLLFEAGMFHYHASLPLRIVSTLLELFELGKNRYYENHEILNFLVELWPNLMNSYCILSPPLGPEESSGSEVNLFLFQSRSPSDDEPVFSYLVTQGAREDEKLIQKIGYCPEFLSIYRNALAYVKDYKDEINFQLKELLPAILNQIIIEYLGKFTYSIPLHDLKSYQPKSSRLGDELSVSACRSTTFASRPPSPKPSHSEIRGSNLEL